MNKCAMSMVGVIGLLLISPVMAASFDCSKASNPYEKAVCANPNLSSLDDQLAVVYKNARAKSADPEALRKTQIDWIKATRQCASDTSCIEKAYKDRMAALGGGAQPQAAATVQAPAAQNNVSQTPQQQAPLINAKPNQMPPSPQATAPVTNAPVSNNGQDEQVRALAAFRSQKYDEAMKLYLISAGKGNVASQVAVGNMYANGTGVNKNPTEAIEWFKRAAQGGNTTAMFNLGTIYLDGVGVKENLRESRKWFQLAADNGDQDAKIMLKKFKGDWTDYPYKAILTCGMPGINDHINILACFAKSGHGAETELMLTNGNIQQMYKAYNLNNAGEETRDGFVINLKSNFGIQAQNSHKTLILSLKIIDTATGKVLIQRQAAQYGVVSAKN